MATKFSFGKIELDVSLGGVKTGRRRDPDAPFVLAVLGDFSGRGNRGVVEPINQRRVWKVDCDNFEQIVAKLGARLGLALAEDPTGAVELKFDSFEDLHPDRLLRTVAPLAALSEARKRLLDPSASADAAREFQALLSEPASAIEARVPSSASAESNEDTLARLLGGSAPQPAAKQPQPGAAVDRLIRNIVAPSIVPGASPQQKGLLSAADLELSRRLRMMLHHADFQALEANWRGLDMLVRNFGGEENLQIRVADISRQEIEADLMAAESLESTGLGKLIQQQMDEQPWSAWVGLYTFDARVDELELLGRVTKLAAGLGAPFLAAASPQLAGCGSFPSHPDPSDWKLPLGTDVAARPLADDRRRSPADVRVPLSLSAERAAALPAGNPGPGRSGSSPRRSRRRRRRCRA